MELTEVIQVFVLPCLWAFGACLAFAVIFNIHGLGMFICGAGGALGWLVYLLCSRPLGLGDMPSALLAGVSISAWSETMARLRKCPVTGYLLVAFFPLVPGGGIYYAMKFAISGQTRNFGNTLMHTVEFAGALALGVLLVSSAVRMRRTVAERRRGQRYGAV